MLAAVRLGIGQKWSTDMGEGMTRRGFLSGIVKSAAAGALVVAASDQEIASFGVGSKVLTGELVDAEANLFPGLGVGMILFAQRGTRDFLPIAVVDDVQYDYSKVDVTPAGSGHTVWAPGGRHVWLTATVAGPVNLWSNLGKPRWRP